MPYMADEATTEVVPQAVEAEVVATDKTFTQDQLDAIVKDRLTRERAKFADHDELKVKAAKLEELEAAGASELEKAQKKSADAEAKAASTLQVANDRLVQGALLAEASKAGVESPELLLGVIDKAGLIVSDDGTVTGLEDAVKAAIEKFPQLVGKGTPGSADQGARGNSPDKITHAQVATMSPEAVSKALKAGELAHLLGG